MKLMFSIPTSSPVLLVALSLAVAGCGSDRPRPVRVEGVITLDGKAEWPDEGTLLFAPVTAAEGFPRLLGRASFDKQGKFVAGTFDKTDGLMPGEYQVQVKCWKKRPSMESPQGVSHLPPRYYNAEMSGISVTVPTGGPIRDMTFDVSSK